MPAKPKFTRIPKMRDLIEAGVPAECVATYCALSDHAHNKTGLCWPKMETLARTLGRSMRTVQRHLHLLKECGLIEFVERRRYKGRFSSYLYKVLHIMRTTGHGRPEVRRRPIYKGTKPSKNTPHSPPTQGYEWLFGEPADLEGETEAKEKRTEARERESQGRREGYEWLFE